MERFTWAGGIAATIQAGFEIFTRFAQEVGTIDAQAAERFSEDCLQALREAEAAQKGEQPPLIQSSSWPPLSPRVRATSERQQEVIDLSQRACGAGTTAAGLGRHKVAASDGPTKEGNIFLDPNAAFKAVQQQSMGAFSVSKGTLWKHCHGAGLLELDFEQRRARRQEASHEILDAFKLWLDDLEPQVLPKSALATAIGYTRRQWAALERYLGDGELFAGSDAGGVRAAKLYSLIASAKRHALEPYVRLPARSFRASPESPRRPTPRTRARLLGSRPSISLRRRHPHPPWRLGGRLTERLRTSLLPAEPEVADQVDGAVERLHGDADRQL